ncbi:MAG: glycosyltransferase [Prevotella sp.]|nr:glycosyltransferase [Prevotella sp.]
MRILLLGEYSNVHNNLAYGLRALGHEVVTANNGDYWKHFDSDINLSRWVTHETGWRARLQNAIHFIPFVCRLIPGLLRMQNFDVVQLINPIFLELKAERHFSIYRYLRKHNKKIVLGAMGDDYYFCHINHTLKPMRYSDYNIGSTERMTDFAHWTYYDEVGTEKERLCRMIAHDCDAIVSGMYEYWLPYSMTEDKDKNGKLLREKLLNIPFPIKSEDIGRGEDNCKEESYCEEYYGREDSNTTKPIKVFVGVSKERAVFKGTDILLQAAKELQHKYPGRIELRIAEGIPFAEYQKLMDSSDVLLDQIYSYGPGMNALLAMSKGIIAVSGGEPEYYDLMGEHDCRPIINVEPTYDSVYHQLENLILHPERLQKLKSESRRYIMRNHDAIKVAQQYEKLYQRLCEE